MNEADCKECANAIFCKSWGEYKCKKLFMRLKKFVRGCPNYIKGTPSTECHCKTCEEKQGGE